MLMEGIASSLWYVLLAMTYGTTYREWGKKWGKV